MRLMIPGVAVLWAVALTWCASFDVLAANGDGAANGEGDWICWRGPNGDSKSDLVGIRKDFSKGLTKRWGVKDLCKGKDTHAWAAPSVKGSILVVPGRLNDDDAVFGFDADTGKPLWKKTYATPGKVPYGSGSRATPRIDGDRVYTFGAFGHLCCWNLADGKEIWTAEVSGVGAPLPFYGHSSSPLIVGDNVIVQSGGDALIVAYNKMTGEVAWRSGKGKAAYAAPVLAELEGKAQVIVFTAAGLAALAPDTGKISWTSKWKTPHDVNCTTPVVQGNEIFVTSSMGKGCQLVRINKGKPKPVWTSKVVASYHSDPVVVDKHMYVFNGSNYGGDFRCVEWGTGKVKWKTKVFGYGTLVHVDGHLLCLSNLGELALVKPDPNKFQLVTKFKAIKGKPVWTIPVVARGNVYVRFVNQLICYELKDGRSNVTAGGPKPDPGKAAQ